MPRGFHIDFLLEGTEHENSKSRTPAQTVANRVKLARIKDIHYNSIYNKRFSFISDEKKKQELAKEKGDDDIIKDIDELIKTLNKLQIPDAPNFTKATNSHG